MSSSRVSWGPCAELKNARNAWIVFKLCLVIVVWLATQSAIANAEVPLTDLIKKSTHVVSARIISVTSNKKNFEDPHVLLTFEPKQLHLDDSSTIEIRVLVDKILKGSLPSRELSITVPLNSLRRSLPIAKTFGWERRRGGLGIGSTQVFILRKYQAEPDQIDAVIFDVFAEHVPIFVKLAQLTDEDGAAFLVDVLIDIALGEKKQPSAIVLSDFHEEWTRLSTQLNPLSPKPLGAIRAKLPAFQKRKGAAYSNPFILWVLANLPVKERRSLARSLWPLYIAAPRVPPITEKTFAGRGPLDCMTSADADHINQFDFQSAAPVTLAALSNPQLIKFPDLASSVSQEVALPFKDERDLNRRIKSFIDGR